MTILDAQVPGSTILVKDRLEELYNLKPDWGGYGETAPFPESIRAIKRILQVLSTPPSICPTYNGGVQAEWHIDGLDIEIEYDVEQGVETWVRVSPV